MPLDEFWNDDPDLLWTYRNSYIQKMEQERNIINYKAWLQGFYNYKAIASAFSKDTKYFEKPIEFNKQPKTQEEQNKLIVEKAKAGAMKIQMLLKQRSEK